MGIDFAVQIHNRVEEEVVLDHESHPIMETAANVGPPLIAATIGAVIAFLALRISKVPMIRDFGLAVGNRHRGAGGDGYYRSADRARRPRMAPQDDHTWRILARKIVVKLGSLSTKWVIPIIDCLDHSGGPRNQDGDGTKIQSDPVRWIDQGSQTVADIATLEERTGFATTLGFDRVKQRAFPRSLPTGHRFCFRRRTAPRK